MVSSRWRLHDCDLRPAGSAGSYHQLRDYDPSPLCIMIRRAADRLPDLCH